MPLVRHKNKSKQINKYCCWKYGHCKCISVSLQEEEVHNHKIHTVDQSRLITGTHRLQKLARRWIDNYDSYLLWSEMDLKEKYATVT